MKFGLPRLRSFLPTRRKALSPPDSSRGFWSVIMDFQPGAWQQDVQPLNNETALSHPTVYACVTQIAADIGKLRARILGMKGSVWQEVTSIPFSPLLRNPNRYQIWLQFIESWLISKLIGGNAYILMVRDGRGVPRQMYPLDWNRVTPLVSDSGAVFYQLQQDNLSGITAELPAVPASEIIHDRTDTLWHPLVGIPPLYAGGLATRQGLAIQKNSSGFFQNASQPGGILTAPGNIDDKTAERLKKEWNERYSGKNAGKVAVLGDGLKYETTAFKPVDSQLVEQLKWSDEKICSVFKVPPYKIYAGPAPAYNNVEALDRIYYSGCLQRHIEAIEALLDNALGFPALGYKCEFDLDDLLRMDNALRMTTVADGAKAGIYAPNEARAKFNLAPVAGGDSPYLQQQNYSLEALGKRDAQDNPFGSGNAPPPPAPPKDLTDEALAALWQKSPEEWLHAA